MARLVLSPRSNLQSGCQIVSPTSALFLSCRFLFVVHTYMLAPGHACSICMWMVVDDCLFKDMPILEFLFDKFLWSSSADSYTKGNLQFCMRFEPSDGRSGGFFDISVYQEISWWTNQGERGKGEEDQRWQQHWYWILALRVEVGLEAMFALRY